MKTLVLKDDVLRQISELSAPKPRELWEALHDLSAIHSLIKQAL